MRKLTQRTCTRPRRANSVVAAAHVAPGKGKNGGGGAGRGRGGAWRGRGLGPRNHRAALARFWRGRTCCVITPQPNYEKPTLNTQRVWKEAQASSGSRCPGSTWPARLECGAGGLPGRCCRQGLRGSTSHQLAVLKDFLTSPISVPGQGLLERFGRGLGPSPRPLPRDQSFPAVHILAGSLTGPLQGSGSMASGECVCACVAGRVSGTEECRFPG